jgi:E3 ubiquitin-protein ligase UBR4
VDPNRVKVLSHDLKSLLKRFACQESFNRDSKGGGPESNMNLVPLIVSMITHCLKNNYGQS